MPPRSSTRTINFRWSLMRQRWDRLLFLHWSVPPHQLFPLLPKRLELDLYGGKAWIGITPFAMGGIRPPLFPPLPLLSRSLEINVRTYASLNGTPGVWFLSLDASNPLVVQGARLAYHLPYFRARMGLREEGGTLRFTSARTDRRCNEATFEAAWKREGAPFRAEPGTLDHFLIERYCLYAEGKGALYRALIRHPPWLLQRVDLLSLNATMAEARGIFPEGPPLLHAQARPLHVSVGPPRRI